MLLDHWPLLGLTVRIADLELRPPNDDELAELGELAAEVVTSQRLRLTRTAWEQTNRPPVTIDGLHPCLPCSAPTSLSRPDHRGEKDGSRGLSRTVGRPHRGRRRGDSLGLVIQ